MLSANASESRLLIHTSAQTFKNVDTTIIMRSTSSSIGLQKVIRLTTNQYHTHIVDKYVGVGLI